MSDSLTASEWAQLSRLARKAELDPSTSQQSADILSSVSAYASRMAGY